MPQLCYVLDSMKLHLFKGTLLVEAIVASFLFLFAFIAATRLFDASLQWESSSSNERLAALVAERRLEDLRGWVSRECKTSGFDALDWASQEVVDQSAPEAGDFLITVKTSTQIQHTQARPGTGRVDPPVGTHSPCSTLYTKAPTGDNQQQSQLWQTFPYSRSLTNSARLAQITVTWGEGRHQYRLVSLLTDSIEQAATPSNDYTTSPVVISGPASVAPGGSASYSVEVHLSNNAPIPDVTTLWTIRPTSAGEASLLPIDSNARTVRLTRRSSGRIVLVAKVRYRGKEFVGFSNAIN